MCGWVGGVGGVRGASKCRGHGKACWLPTLDGETAWEACPGMHAQEQAGAQAFRRGGAAPCGQNAW